MNRDALLSLAIWARAISSFVVLATPVTEASESRVIITRTPAYFCSSSRQYRAICSVRSFSQRPLPTAPESQPPWPASKTKTQLRARTEFSEMALTADSNESNEAPAPSVNTDSSWSSEPLSDRSRYGAATSPTLKI